MDIFIFLVLRSLRIAFTAASIPCLAPAYKDANAILLIDTNYGVISLCVMQDLNDLHIDPITIIALTDWALRFFCR